MCIKECHQDTTSKDEREGSRRGQGEKVRVMQTQWSLSQPQGVWDLEWSSRVAPNWADVWVLISPHWSVSPCMWAALGRTVAWDRAALCGWGNPWRCLELQVFCQPHSQELSNKIFLEGGAGWCITVFATSNWCFRITQGPSKTQISL